MATQPKRSTVKCDSTKEIPIEENASPMPSPREVNASGSPTKDMLISKSLGLILREVHGELEKRLMDRLDRLEQRLLEDSNSLPHERTEIKWHDGTTPGPNVSPKALEHEDKEEEKRTSISGEKSQKGEDAPPNLKISVSSEKSQNSNDHKTSSVTFQCSSSVSLASVGNGTGSEGTQSRMGKKASMNGDEDERGGKSTRSTELSGSDGLSSKETRERKEYKCRDIWMKTKDDNSEWMGVQESEAYNRRGGDGGLDMAGLQQLVANSASLGGFVRNGFSMIVRHPNCHSRLTWDIVGMILISYDLVTIPLFMAFDPTPTTFTITCFWITLLFWTSDIPFTFMSGYYDGGVVEMRMRRIAKHYLKTWFFLDLIVVGIDWFSVFMGASAQEESRSVRYGKTLRSIRVLRSLRLLRLMKLKRIMEALEDRIASNVVHIFLDVLKLLAMVILINHFVACCWWGIGVSQGGKGWVDILEYDETSMEYQYTTSMHWSITQFTPGSMEVFPQNAPERAFNVFILLVGLVIFSSFISSITAAMTRLRQLSSESDQQFTILRRYLRDHAVPQQLAVRIKKYLEHAVAHQKSVVQPKDVLLLQQLSVPLRMDLQLEEHRPLLMIHPFFRRYAHVDCNALRQICTSAIKVVNLSEGDNLFTVGTSCAKMYILKTGMLKYSKSAKVKLHSKPDSGAGSQAGAQSGSRDTTISRLGPRDTVQSRVSSAAGMGVYMNEKEWCCEAALWTAWVHLGTLRANTMCEVIAIDTKGFSEQTMHFHTVGGLTSLYAQAFVDRLNETSTSELSDLPDEDGLWVSEVEEMVEAAFDLRNERRFTQQITGFA